MERPEDYGAWRVHLDSSRDRGDGRGAHALSKVLGVNLDTTRRVLARAPVEIPKNLSQADARALASDLREAGLDAEAKVVVHATAHACREHPQLANDGQCEHCEAWICIACRANADGAAMCPSCFQKHGWWALFRYSRIAILLAILVGVSAWGWSEHRRLEERRLWAKPLRIGVVVLELEPIEASTVSFLGARLDNLEEILDDEFKRYTSRTMRPFEFVVIGSTSVRGLPPEGPSAEGGFLENLETTMGLSEYLDGPAASLGMNEDDYDSVIWVVARDGEKAQDGRFVEGLAEVGGDRGVVVVDLDESTAALTAAVIAHELLHTLGATDKYDASGPRWPHGYYDRSPRYPQKRAEIMAREIPVTEAKNRLPRFVGELGIGPRTAAELGWIEEE